MHLPSCDAVRVQSLTRWIYSVLLPEITRKEVITAHAEGGMDEILCVQASIHDPVTRATCVAFANHESETWNRVCVPVTA